VIEKPTIPILRNLFSLDNMQFLDIEDKRENLIKKIQDFNPAVIGSYPEVLRHIAALIEAKNIGNIKPRCILTTGDMIKMTQSPEFDPDRSAG